MYNWSNGVSTQDIINIGKGAYSVTIVDASACTTVGEINLDCVWPGDTDDNNVVNNFDLLNIGIAYDSMGPVRPGATLSWQGQAADSWPQQTPDMTNYKHVDCNGDGIINADDTLAITLNWDSVHSFTGDTPLETESINAPFYVEPDTLVPNQAISLDIILGEMANPVTDLYGIAFSILYDTSVVVAGSAKIKPDPSWLGMHNTNMLSVQKDFPSAGRIDVALTRIDGIEITDYGTLCKFDMIIQDDILFAPPGDGEPESGGGKSAEFAIDNVLMITFERDTIAVIPTTTSAVISTISSVYEIDPSIEVLVQPNPASNQIFVTLPSGVVPQYVYLANVYGQIVYASAQSNTTFAVDVHQLSNGVYILQVVYEDGRMSVERVVKNGF